MELVDICFNFTNSVFRDDEVEVVKRAKNASVSQFIITGSDVKDSKDAFDLAQKYSGMYSTVGVHPHLAKDWSKTTLEKLNKLAMRKNVVAIGETGLDYNRNYSNTTEQKYAFESQLELAVDLKLPVFLHQRDAHKDFSKFLEKYRSQLCNVVVHCFTDTENALKFYLELDCHIGITGWICDERRGHHLLKFIHLIPNNRLMIETDSPYLLPRDLPHDENYSKPKGRRNEPAYLPHILKTIAKARDTELEQIAKETTQTARNFFALS